MADSEIESPGDLWALFLGKAQGRGNRQWGFKDFQQDAVGYASVTSDNGESRGQVFSQ